MRAKLAWVWVILWLLLIFAASSQPAFVLALDNWLDFLIKKTAHFAMYAILAYLLARALRENKIFISTPTVLGIILFCFLYALSDEFHQSFVPGRQPHIRDVFIDTVGAGFGTYLFTRLHKTTG